ncbi:unnamed protein product [Urochloa decumbens]|uniref:KIB1-4 beta-propeller domain-containing protein n=1 Tax=Urochloa decumbens TaxID=240449 RepID=A0ABC9CME6_9POAL
MQLTKLTSAATPRSSHTDANDASHRGVSGGGGTVDLPLDLTEKILYGISPLASARLATVCKSWAAIVSDRLKRLAPHLFVYLPADHRLDRRGVVVSVPLDSSAARGHPAPAAIPCRVRLKDTTHLRCVGAMPASGRLAFANYSWCKNSVLLVNPITGARRSVNVGRLRGNPVVPSGGAADSFVPIAIDELVIWRRRRVAGGEEWLKSTVQDGACRTDAIMSVASCHNGRFFYMLDRNGHVFVVDAGAPPPLLRVDKLPAASLFRRFAPPHPSHVTGHGYLLGSDDEVLFVRRVLAYKDDGPALCKHRADDLLSVVGFKVYRLDDAEGRSWTEVEELAGGDRALFVSPASSFAVRASETEGCRSNCIYFVDKRRCYSCHKDDGITWGVYSMEDREISFKHTITEPGPCTSATWFLPRVA